MFIKSVTVSVAVSKWELFFIKLRSESRWTVGLLLGYLTISKRHKKQTEKANTQANKQLECGPMPNLMVALPNTGGALCSTPQSLADAHY